MGRKNVVKTYRMIDQEDLSGNITSDPTSVINQDKASIAVSWNGVSPVGSVTIEAKNGEKEPFRTIAIGPGAVSGNTGNHDFIFNELPFTDIRVVYTASSGTGTLDAVITSKTIGA